MTRTNKKSFAFRVVAVVLALILGILPAVFSPAGAAATIADLQKEYNRLEQKIKDSESKLDELKEQKDTETEKFKELQGQITDLQAQLAVLEEQQTALNESIRELNNNIKILDGQIADLDKEIAENEEQIAQTEAEIAQTRDQIAQRLRANYMSGNASELQLILASNDLSSIMIRAEYVKKASQQDKALIDKAIEQGKKLEKAKAELEKQKKDLDDKKAAVEADRATLLEQKKTLDENMSTMRSKQRRLDSKYRQSMRTLDSIDKDTEKYEDYIEEYNASLKKIDAQIDAMILADKSDVKETTTKKGSSGGSSGNVPYGPSSSGWLWPVPEYTNISAGYGYYYPFGKKEFHYGIDIKAGAGDASIGKRILAAQSGTVVEAGYLGDRGNYVLIHHGDGVYSIYMHCSKLLVKSGQQVSRGEKIAEIGKSGRVTGAHLHFEVRVKNGNTVTRVDPMKYVSAP